MITQFLLNVAILVSLSVISALLIEHFSGKRVLHDGLQGLLFGLTAVFAMMHPVPLGDGLIFDARSVVLSLCGWFFGPFSAILSSPLAVLYRMALGGSGVLPGILTVGFSAAAGLILYYQRPLSKHLPRAWELLVFGIVVHILLVIIILLMIPNTYAFQVAPTILTIHPLATLICGKVLVNQYRLRDTLNTLNIQNEHIHLITESMRDVLWILDYPALTFSYVSPSNIHHTGYTPAEAKKLPLEETLSPDSYQDVLSWLQTDLAAANEPEASKFPRTRLIQERCKDGSFIWSEISIAVAHHPNGEPAQIIGVSRDVTRRVEQENALQTSLNEKNALLKEVHHRVKNNLQIITSLLRLEASRISEPQSREVILDMQRRVRSMSLLHETVYQSDSLARIDMEIYFKKLSHQVLNTMSSRSTRAQPLLDIAPVQLDLEQAIPCGLLLNELLSNALKHAFDKESTGHIRIRLHTKNETHLVLEVSENGKGLPPDFQTRRKHSLGLQLVDDLTRQLSGVLEIQSTAGTSFRITFPASGVL